MPASSDLSTITELVNSDHLADRMQACIDNNHPVVLFQIKINQATKVVRLLQSSHLRAEEQLIQIVSRKIESAFADSSIFRLGKTTFMVWMPGIYMENKERILRFSVEHSPFQVMINGADYYPKLSIGATELNRDIAETMSRLEFACDKAFRSSGANLYFVKLDNKEMKKDISLYKGLRDVRVALQDNTLGLYAQPIVDLHNPASLPKYELLLREFRDGEVYPPGQLLEISEFNGVTQDVDLYVVNLLAKNFAGLFGKQGELVDAVSINISGDSYSSHRFNKTLQNIFADHEIPSEKIILEVTENIANADTNAAIETMNKFKSAGYRLALDDIGVGSSNFKSLFDFPVDYFKIDRSYCESMCDNEAVRAFIQIIINEANKTHKKTIAEGIPDEETLELLKSMGVNYSQSFITGTPQPLIPAPGA